MNAIWSFWTKPFFAARASSWHTDWHHWLAWGLSLSAASRHYQSTHLVTDDEGARVLIDDLQLPFQSVSTALNRLDDEDPAWWSLGKIEAYRLQQEPFVHIDTDVFLWKRLPRRLENADVFAQNREAIGPGPTIYRPWEVEEALGYPDHGWLPEEWPSFRKHPSPSGACCGILGGQNVELIRRYAETALRLIRDPLNEAAMRAFAKKEEHMVLLEQYLVVMCAEYRRVTVEYLFDELGDAYHPEYAADLGYTHLASDAKRNRRIAALLERRVSEDLPEHYHRCMRLVYSGVLT
jgi:hypothetical protein